MRKCLSSIGVWLCLLTSTAVGAPLYPNSVVSNDLDFIKTTDQSAFACLKFAGTRRAEMPDKRTDTLFANGAFIFTAHFGDGTAVEFWAHPKFGSRKTAMQSVEPALFAWAMHLHPGRLPKTVEKRVQEIMPNRLAFFKALFLAGPVFESTGNRKGC